MRSQSVKESSIGLTVSEILWYTQTDILLFYYKGTTKIKATKSRILRSDGQSRYFMSIAET